MGFAAVRLSEVPTLKSESELLYTVCVVNVIICCSTQCWSRAIPVAHLAHIFNLDGSLRCPLNFFSHFQPGSNEL